MCTVNSSMPSYQIVRTFDVNKQLQKKNPNLATRISYDQSFLLLCVSSYSPLLLLCDHAPAVICTHHGADRCIVICANREPPTTALSSGLELSSNSTNSRAIGCALTTALTAVPPHPRLTPHPLPPHLHSLPPHTSPCHFALELTVSTSPNSIRC